MTLQLRVAYVVQGRMRPSHPSAVLHARRVPQIWTVMRQRRVLHVRQAISLCQQHYRACHVKLDWPTRTRTQQRSVLVAVQAALHLRMLQHVSLVRQE